MTRDVTKAATKSETRDDRPNSASLYHNDAEFRRDTHNIHQYLERSRFWRNVVLLLVVLAPLASFFFYYLALQSGQGLWSINSLLALLMTSLVSGLLIYSVLQNHNQVTKSLQLVEKQRDLFLEYSHTDPLTGALNRRVFKSAYRVAEAQLRRNNLPFALITMDIDHFKRINDKHGHDIGDEVLCAMVRELQKIIRPSDILMRMGGEEFSILCNLADQKQALSMAEKLRTAAAALEVRTSTGQSIHFTISLGVHIIGNNDTMESALKHADIALYHAKAGGRNCTVIYSAGLEA